MARCRGALARLRSGLAVVAAAAIGSLALGTAAAGEATRVPGTSVRLEPPPGFVAADRFPGFAHKESQSSIQVTVVPGPIAEVRKGLTKEGLAKNGMALVSQSVAKVNEQFGLLVHVRQTANDVTFAKWILVAGDEKATVLIVASTPAPAPEPIRTALTNALLGARWDPAAPVDLFEGLPFRLVPSGTLTETKRMGPMLLLTEPGKPGVGVERAVYVAGVSSGDAPDAPLAKFAAGRATQTAATKDLENVRGVASEVAGREAYELLADAKDARSSAPVLLYQVVVRDGTGYWIVQGIVAAERAAECLPLFRRITASITSP
ncbi:MAG: hypothetical protein IT460_15545 [Planctomycetes bacterium]|nr:hypothetical protein [Planctomycetota bacterium]